MSIATSLTVQGPRPLDLGGGSSVVDLFGTNLNVPSVQVGDSSNYGTGSITNNGYLSPNGSLTLTGNYTQTSGGELFEQWPQGSLVVNELNVNGNATLSGYLVVGTDAAKNPPKSGSTYAFMTFGSRSGELTSVNTWISVKYNTNSAVAKFH